jgi:hypothetical protein
LSETAFLKEVAEDRAKWLAPIRQAVEHAGMSVEQSESFANAELYFDNEMTKSWRLNEVVAWISVFVFGDEIRGEGYYLRRVKKDWRRPFAPGRITKNRIHREFQWFGTLFQVSLVERESSMAIFEDVQEALLKEAYSGRFEGRFVDLNAFSTLGPLIPWRRLLAVEKLDA